MLALNLNERADFLPSWLERFTFNTQELWRYPNRQPYERQLAEFWGIDADKVILTNGGDEGISLLFQYARLNNRRMIIPMPMFSQYWYSVPMWQVDNCLIEPTDTLQMDTDAVFDAMQTGDIVMLTTPNNPTGERLDTDTVLSIVEKAKTIDAMVVIDQAYCDFSNDTHTYLDILKTSDNVVLLRTFSKAYGLAGVRLGYLMGGTAFISKLQHLSMPFNVSRTTLSLLPICLSDVAQAEVKSYCQQIIDNRKQLRLLLVEKGFDVFDGQGNFVFFRTDNPVAIDGLYQALFDNNILIKKDFVGLGTAYTDKPFARITVPYDTTQLFNTINSWG